jgi:lipopolysaccharide transport system ATP-binding protein
MTTVISVENLSKTYRLGQIGTGTFTHDLAVWWAKVRGRPNPMLKIGEADHGNRDGEELMALRDVSFTVEQGEVLGIIGRNGAGKSTLLKILSRVTAPTSGRIRVKGRVASLLEVGTGFHPELTGRENIYLNGAILGMTKGEVTRKFDEIVDFAEVEKFIDTPVKRYSSGMYVRLAFAVAAHLDPEILVVDEVLAVGDAEFQKKCLGKMGEVAKEGRTVLFVSHNMAAILNLCSRSILLHAGEAKFSGDTTEVVNKFLAFQDTQCNVFNPALGSRVGSQLLRIDDFEIFPRQPKTGSSIRFVFHISDNRQIKSSIYPELAISFLTEHNAPLFQLYSVNSDDDLMLPANFGKAAIETRLDNLPLAPGRYLVNLWLGSGQQPIDWIKNCVLLEVSTGILKGKQYVESRGYPIVLSSSWH